MEICRGNTSPGRTPAFKSWVLAVIFLVDAKVRALLLSLFLPLAPDVDWAWLVIWKLCELPVTALGELTSLNSGLGGDRVTGESVDGMEVSVSPPFSTPAEADSGPLSPEACLTLALTMARLLTGSSDMT